MSPSTRPPFAFGRAPGALGVVDGEVDEPGWGQLGVRAPGVADAGGDLAGGVLHVEVLVAAHVGALRGPADDLGVEAARCDRVVDGQVMPEGFPGRRGDAGVEPGREIVERRVEPGASFAPGTSAPRRTPDGAAPGRAPPPAPPLPGSPAPRAAPRPLLARAPPPAADPAGHRAFSRGPPPRGGLSLSAADPSLPGCPGKPAPCLTKVRRQTRGGAEAAGSTGARKRCYT